MTVDDDLAWVDAYRYGASEDESVETMARFRRMAAEIRALRADVIHWKAIAEAPRKRTGKPPMRLRMTP